MAGMLHPRAVPMQTLHLVLEAKILVLQLLVLYPKPLNFLMSFRAPTTAKSRPIKIDEQTRDEHTHDQRRGKRQQSFDKSKYSWRCHCLKNSCNAMYGGSLRSVSTKFRQSRCFYLIPIL